MHVCVVSIFFRRSLAASHLLTLILDDPLPPDLKKNSLALSSFHLLFIYVVELASLVLHSFGFGIVSCVLVDPDFGSSEQAPDSTVQPP